MRQSVAQNGPSRDVKLTFAQIAPPPGGMVLRGINPNGSIGVWYAQR